MWLNEEDSEKNVVECDICGRRRRRNLGNMWELYPNSRRGIDPYLDVCFVCIQRQGKTYKDIKHFGESECG